MNYRRPSFLRYAATIFFSYLLSVYLLLLITCLILLRTVFSPIYMLNMVDRSRFSEQALAEIQDIYISHGTASGIPGEVMLSVLKHRHVDDAIKAEICAVYGKGRAYDYGRYEDEVFDALHAYAAGQGFEPTDELDEALRDLAQVCVDDFAEHLISPAIDILGSAALRYGRYLYMAIAVTAAFAGLTAALLPMLNRRVSGWISGYMYALGGTSIICAAIPAYASFTGLARYWNITPLSYNRLFSSWVEGLAEGYLVALIPLLSLFAICLTIWLQQRK